MAKRKRKSTRSARRSSPLSARRSTRRRRRRMSAGGQGIFKMLSDPLIGGIAGGIAGKLLGNMAGKMMKDNKLIAAGVPIAVAFFIKKKMPFVAAGMAVAPAVSLLASKIPFLAENENISFVSESLLADDSPIFLSDDEGQDLLSERGYSLADYDEGYLSDEDED